MINNTDVNIDILIYINIVINIESSHTFDGGEWKASFFSIYTTIYIYYSIDFYLFVGVAPSEELRTEDISSLTYVVAAV